MTEAVLTLLAAQILLGGLDNLMHHELIEKLPARISARFELALHGARELIYAVLFLALAWLAPHGLWAWALLTLLAVEIIITLADFIEEDRTRTLPPFERVLHTILAVNFGALIALGAPSWVAWAAAPTALAAAEHGLFSWFLTLSAVGVGAWSIRDLAAALMLSLRARTTPATPHETSGRTWLVTGATGFLGEALVRRRLALGDRVIVLTRDPKRATALFDDARVLAISNLDVLPETQKLDGVVNLAGAGVANALWTPGRKRELLHSRLQAAQAVGALLARLEQKCRVLVNASAVGFYGDRGEALLREQAAPGSGFTSALCAHWERAASAAGAHAGRTVRLRFGLVLGRDGGAWPRLALAHAFKIAAQFGDGRQWMSWIHKEDALGLIEAALTDEQLCGVVNAVAPQQARHGEFVAAMARASGAWLTLAAPAGALRLGLGELAHLFLDSQRTAADAALATGYEFQFPDIDSATADLFGRSASTVFTPRFRLRRPNARSGAPLPIRASRNSA
jgi:uncharacterized protein (TIGR01777 family)